MIDLQRLKQKVRYNSITRLLRDGMVKFGIIISPFYLVVERLIRTLPEFEAEEFCGYTAGYFDESDMTIIAAAKEIHTKENTLLMRLSKGCKCLGVKKNGDIAAFTWFNLKECSFNGYRFNLKDNEAYLFDAYTFIKYRGEKIAPYIRYQCYKELNKLGRTTFYSISETLNKQSINFKKKLGARFVYLGLYISLFNKLKVTLRLKNLMPKEEYV